MNAHLFKLYYSCHMQLLWNLLTKSNMVDQNHIYNVYNHLYKGPSWNLNVTTIEFHTFLTLDFILIPHISMGQHNYKFIVL